MSLSEYFETAKGTGVLATSDNSGNVDVALYARPHFVDEDTVAFIMNERLSYRNVISNPKAAYIFIEDAPNYQGKRLYLNMTSEETDKDLIDSIRRKTSTHHVTDSKKHLVCFKIVNTRPLTGD